VIYSKALLFTYPGVDPAHPEGFVMEHGCAEFFEGAVQPFELDHARAVDLVRGAMGFRLRYDFNAQFALVSRRLIESLAGYGDFYQSDFPDYYSMNAAFLRARRIVIEPHPRVVVGVTPKSYGYFHVNDMESAGRDFLDGASAAEATGTNINVGWLSAVTALEQGVAGEEGLRVDHRRYRFVQAAYVYQRQRAGLGSPAEVSALERELPLSERWGYRLASAAAGLVHRLLPPNAKAAMVRFLAHRLVRQLPTIDPAIVEDRYRDILDVCDDRSEAASARAAQPGGD
jgi:hypothetical protein